MTFSPRDQQIIQVRPTMIVIEEDNSIERRGDYYLQRPRSGRWLALVVVAVGLIWLFFPDIFQQSQQSVAVAPTSIPTPVVIDIAEIRQTLHRQLDFEVRGFSVTTIVTLTQDNDDFLWFFSVDKTSVDYHAVGRVMVGYNLLQASVIEGKDGTIHVFLPPPTVLDVDAQPELSYFEIETPTHGEVDAETMTAILSRVEGALEQAAYARGIVAEGNNSGPALVQALFPNVERLEFHTQAPQIGVSQ